LNLGAVAGAAAGVQPRAWGDGREISSSVPVLPYRDVSFPWTPARRDGFIQLFYNLDSSTRRALPPPSLPSSPPYFVVFRPISHENGDEI